MMRFEGMRGPTALAVAGAIVALTGATARAVEPSPLVVPKGLEATLFAAEPLLSSPSDIDVDSRGRVWVCEVLNYRGKKETRAEGDRILVLEDTDGDGRADKQTVFHQGRDVDSALGICVIGEGPGRKVIVSCAPDVFIFHDDDGDLKADRRESLFTKTGQPQHDHSVHAFVVGPDGRLYFNFGNTGKGVHDRDGKPVIDRFGNAVLDTGKPYRQGMVFRCRPDGSDFEVLGHNFRNNYEVAVDSFGTLWQSDNDDDGNRGVRINWVMEYGNYGYKNEITGASWQTARTNIEPDSPERHWHLNDPGVVPNLLQTGNGSPCGICVYEGTLLPERYRGALLHCDAGPNVVRSYHVAPAGAGFTATMKPLADGSADKWFRPCDVCVAPDGSVLVADWYDPGVGGHGMGDTEKGRIYRIAPQGAAWTVPAVDLKSVAGAIAALASPNLCTRAISLERLAKEPDTAAAALARAAGEATDQRLKARLVWAEGMLPGRATQVIDRLAVDPDAALRCIAVRMCRLTQGDVLSLVERLATDASPAVRREAAIALRGVAGERADRVWAELAAQHTAGDRWETEALGIGADSVAGFGGPSHWDGRLAAWMAKVGDGWKTPAGREIVWRSRAAATPRMLCELIVDPAITTAESLALARALDFQDQAAMQREVRGVVASFAAPEEKLRVILPELVLRLEPAANNDPAIAARIAEAAEQVAGTQAFVDIVKRFALRERVPQLLAIAATPGAGDQLAVAAAAVAVQIGDEAAWRAGVAAADATAVPALLASIGSTNSNAARIFLESLLTDADVAPEAKAAAVLGMGRSQAGAKRLVELAEREQLTGTLPQAAAAVIALSPWADIKQAAAKVLPMPQAKGGGALPTIAELSRRGRGNPARGKAVFAGAGTCAKCHVVGDEGKSVGPNLSGIGAKLSRVAMYEAILAPSAAISHNYETYTAVLDDGRAVTGLLVSQSPEEVVIRGADGIDVTMKTAEVEELVKQPVSLMPADLAAALTVDELVDLVAWLETLRN
jgi:putative membrane-bound dehydrogenase-like protein